MSASNSLQARTNGKAIAESSSLLDCAVGGLMLQLALFHEHL